jgi:D-sedoheptulose 7-phosphate isomerase
MSIANNHFKTLSSLMQGIDLEVIGDVFDLLREARDQEATVYVAGNGGSAATATHWATDLGKSAKLSGRTPIRIMCLNDNISWVTALANDEGYERAFAGQLENFARPRDVLVVISASGNSPNLIQAVEMAKERGVTTVGFLGFDGGALKNMVDHLIWAETDIGEYEQAEDCHMSLCHILTMCLAQDRIVETSAG